MLSFKFSSEALEPEKKDVVEQGGPAEVGSLLFQTEEGTRIDYVTNARQHGIKWFPELQYSVVYAFADTWACICCRCPRFGCTRPVNCGACNFYRISFTRAQWLYAFNVVCFAAHLAMYYLCITSCNGDRFGTKVNTNCTSEQMEINLVRIRSNWTSEGADGYEVMFVESGSVRFDFLAAWFHGLSALAHAAVVLVGPFDRFAFLYWKCIDQAFCWWRCAHSLKP